MEKLIQENTLNLKCTKEKNDVKAEMIQECVEDTKELESGLT